MSRAATELKKSLGVKGQRLTSQRQLVLQILEEAGGHLDAEAIFQQAHTRDVRVSLATVYRTLQLLKEMGLIDQHFVSRQHAREVYEPVGASEHCHFTCLECGQVIEFRSALVDQVSRQIEVHMEVAVLHTCVCFEGYCPACRVKAGSHELP